MDKKYLDYELKDDDTSFGGVAFKGETLRDFCEECGINIETTTIKEINAYLKECGIMPIETTKYMLVVNTYGINSFGDNFNIVEKIGVCDSKEECLEMANSYFEKYINENYAVKSFEEFKKEKFDEYKDLSLENFLNLNSNIFDNDINDNYEFYAFEMED